MPQEERTDEQKKVIRQLERVETGLKNRNKEVWKWVRQKLVSLLVDINLSRSSLRNSVEG